MAALVRCEEAKKRKSSDFYLPQECFECMLKFLKDDNHSLESLSLVSKQFLSITNSLKLSLTILNPTLPFLHVIFHRFNNLSSINLSCCDNDLNNILIQISNFSFNKLTSLNISNQPKIPFKGLKAFTKKITTITSLVCSNLGYIHRSSFFLIDRCFPLLEQLDLSDPNPIIWRSFPYNHVDDDSDNDEQVIVNAGSTVFSKLRKFNLSGNHYIDDELINNLFKHCNLLEEATLLNCCNISDVGIASAICERPTLRSLSFTNISPTDISRRRQSKQYATFVTSDFIDSLVTFKGLTCIQFFCVNISDDFLSSIAIHGLPLKKLVLQYCPGYTYKGIFGLIFKSQHIQHLDLRPITKKIDDSFINDENVLELSLFLRDLVYVNFTTSVMLTELALFALVKNCPSLSEIVMEGTQIGEKEILNSLMMDSVVRPQLKSLHFADNPWLRDENITMIASIFPNLQLLDLSKCNGISGEGIAQVLKRCRKIKQLKLAYCSRVNLLCGMNFHVPKLQVLNLSHTDVNDETLYVISKSCCGLLQLLVENCHGVTKKGVKHVLRNCVQLREINLKNCYEVDANVVASMVLSRPSLRKITNKLVS